MYVKQTYSVRQDWIKSIDTAAKERLRLPTAAEAEQQSNPYRAYAGLNNLIWTDTVLVVPGIGRSFIKDQSVTDDQTGWRYVGPFPAGQIELGNIKGRIGIAVDHPVVTQNNNGAYEVSVGPSSRIVIVGPLYYSGTIRLNEHGEPVSGIPEQTSVHTYGSHGRIISHNGNAPYDYQFTRILHLPASPENSASAASTVRPVARGGATFWEKIEVHADLNPKEELQLDLLVRNAERH